MGRTKDIRAWQYLYGKVREYRKSNMGEEEFADDVSNLVVERREELSRWLARRVGKQNGSLRNQLIVFYRKY